ncbi:MAG: TetR family transcriptional regulator [Actinomycetota bacterium]|nr:TetR family transcriptional regulator [Actinomycetota bacterium]
MPGDPLFDTLFRPTTVASSLASAAPVTTPGTRSRAGNAMNRTRAALLDGARRAVEVSGTKITMAQVAAAAGVAKATLYNHFRTRDAVLAAVLIDEVNAVVAATEGMRLPEALGTAANHVAGSPLLRRLARLEPATLAAVACVDDGAEGWRIAREAISAALAANGRGGTETVLRWLSSYVTTPASPTTVNADLAVLLAGLPAVTEVVPPATIDHWEAQPA